MRKYETVFISDPDLQDQTRTELFERVRSIITRENGIVLDFDDWGNKKLAYEIKKKLRGHYVCMTYGGTGELVTELERNFRLSDHIMKFMTILLADNVTAEELEKEAEQAQKEKSEQVQKSAETAEEQELEEAPEAEEQAQHVAVDDDQEKEEPTNDQASEEEKAEEQN
jgi:small subunit ribosomal protein S6